MKKTPVILFVIAAVLIGVGVKIMPKKGEPVGLTIAGINSRVLGIISFSVAGILIIIGSYKFVNTIN